MRGGIDDDVGAHRQHRGGQLLGAAEVGVEVGAVEIQRDHFAEWREAALQLPADLSTFAEQQQLHAEAFAGAASYCFSTHSRYAPLCTLRTHSPLARYHWTVLRMPVSKVSAGFQPSSASSLRASMA
ncbi:hypothetical protein D9M69_692460 [compost metagenome]